MNETRLTIQTLKKELRKRGVTYAKVAEHLEMSEANVKKMFSNYHFTLQRIDSICKLIDLSLVDLIRIMDEDKDRISSLTLEQEEFVMKNKKICLVALCARNNISFNDILDTFNISKSELYQAISELEKMKLVELHPYDRIKFLPAPDFEWIPDGPIDTYFKKHMLNEFIHHSFHEECDMRMYLAGLLTQECKKELNRKLRKLVLEFNELVNDSMAAPYSDKENIAFLFATCAWEAPFITRLRREKE